MVNTLGQFRRQRHLRAERGAHGRGKEQHGKKGADIQVVVPIGTLVWKLEGEGKLLLADLVQDGMRVCVAKGGVGGRGNKTFATPTSRVPRLAEQGGFGEEVRLMLEVKLLADAGIVGKPNAGKSTLLAAVSGARPKVAEYPFTTIEPVLGVVRTPTDEMVLLEIPGLILGAHEGAGLGLEFLRHVERTRALIHLLDGSTADPLRDLEEVRQELEAYQAALLERPVIVVINKIDIEEVRRRLPDLQRRLEGAGYRVHAISAATGEGLDTLLKRVRELLSEAPRLDGPRVEAPPLAQPVPRNVSPRVRREDGVLVVESLQAARLVGGSDLGDRRVLLQLRSELRRLGVLRELERAGVKHGDTVRIGEVELEWD